MMQIRQGETPMRHPLRASNRAAAVLRQGAQALGLGLALLLAACANQQGGNNSAMPGNSGGPRSGDRQASTNDGRPAGDPRESAKVHTELAFGYFQRGQMAVALEEVRIALNARPDYFLAYNVLGLINMDLGDNVKAEDAFHRALTIAPNDSDTLNNYGWFLCQTKRERQAIPQFMQALKDPLYATPVKPYLNAGVCSQRIGDDAAAEDYFRKAFSLDPANPGALLNLGELYLKRSDLVKARFYAERLNKSYDPSPQSLWLALRIERKAGDLASETSFATQLRRRFPNSAEYQRLSQGQFE
jgi:type IV pilus assembly protein PilF